MITPEQIKQDRQIKTYIERADDTCRRLATPSTALPM